LIPGLYDEVASDALLLLWRCRGCADADDGSDRIQTVARGILEWIKEGKIFS
jgi:hypothetical protein